MMMYYDHYDGSKLFVFLSTRIGLPIDLVNFLIAQVAALCLARLFRKPLRFASPEFRHTLCLVSGLLMGYFCFGRQSVHLSVLPMLNYVLLKTIPQHILGNVILASSMLYLSCFHLHRQIYHSGDYTLDITGPLMVITQRVTSLAYLLQDSLVRREINANCTRNSKGDFARIDKVPSPLEYFAYTLAFQTLMCGPVVFYADYIKFIEGVRIDEATSDDYVCEACWELSLAAVNQNLQENTGNEQQAGTSQRRGHVKVCVLCGCSLLKKQSDKILRDNPTDLQQNMIDIIKRRREPLQDEKAKSSSEPSPRRAVFYKVAGSVAAALLYLTLENKYPMTALEELTDPSSEVSRSWSALYLLWYAYLSTLVVRCKYYHAWLLSEAICNNCGMGFNGYDNDGAPKWDKMSNIDIFGFELAQNFRTAVASWNKNTNAWLRSVAYSRGSAAGRTARVYTLSAVWHGFHPGYYFTFFAGGLFTVAARKIHYLARPKFLDSPIKKMLYDSLTFITTRVAMTYATVPFVLLHLAPSLAFYGKFYYSLHFIALGAMLIPEKSNRLSKSSELSSKASYSKRTDEENGKLKVT